MQKMITTLLLCFILIKSFGQTQRSYSLYLQGQYTKTLYDVTKGNNPWGMGLGLQLFLNSASSFKPTVELTADTYLEDDKVLRLNTDGTPIKDMGGVINIFAGLSYHPSQKVYLSLVSGPSFINGQTLFGIKPSFGLYFSSDQKWTGKVANTNIYNRHKRTNEDFGSIGLSIGVRLF